MIDRQKIKGYLPKIIGGVILLVAIIYVFKIIGSFVSQPPVKHEKKNNAYRVVQTTTPTTTA